MKRFVYSEGKNVLIQKHHGISFEEIIDALEAKKILIAFPHPNHRKYPHQTILIVQIVGYAYVVPMVESKQSVFLKTAFPSRKYTKKYLKKRKESV